MFTVNHEEAFTGYEEIKDGEYEVIIGSIAENATKGGAEFIDCQLIIRNDIQQAHKNQRIFHKIWKSKETGKYSIGMLQALAKYAQLPNGKQYPTLDPFFNDLFGRPLKVKVKNESSEYNGKTYENLNVKEMFVTGFPNVQHQFKNDNQQGNGGYAQGNGVYQQPNPQEMTFQEQMQSGMNIRDEDLPF